MDKYKEIFLALKRLSLWFKKEINRLWDNPPFDYAKYEALKDSYLFYVVNIFINFDEDEKDPVEK